MASIVAYFSVRKADEPPDESHPYGHEKVENVAAGIEGHADPRRRRDHHLRGGSPAHGPRRGREARRRHRRDRRSRSSPTSWSRRYLYRQAAAHGLAGARGRRGASADRRLHVGRRAARARARRDDGRRGARRDHGAGRRRWRSSGRGSRSSAARAGCSSTRRCQRRSSTPVRAAIAELRLRRGRRVPQAARAPRGSAPLRRPARAVQAGTTLERAHELAHELQREIRARAPRRGRPDPPRAGGELAGTSAG